MGISLSTTSLSEFFWMLAAVYVAVVWIFRIRIHRGILDRVRQRALDVSLSGSVDLGPGASTIADPWVPSQNVIGALLGLQLIPCLWGPVGFFAFALATLSAPAIGGLLGLCLLVSATVTAWFCHRARGSVLVLGRDLVVMWRRSAVGAMITGVLLIATVVVTLLAAKSLGAADVLIACAVAGVTLLLGIMMSSTVNEVATAETNRRIS